MKYTDIQDALATLARLSELLEGKYLESEGEVTRETEDLEAQKAAVADLLRRVPAEVITVMLGGNDLLNGASAEDAALRMEALLRCMTEHAGKAGILLIAPPPMRFGDWVQTQELIDESIKLGGLYRRTANALGVAFADAGEWGVALAFLARGARCLRRGAEQSAGRMITQKQHTRQGVLLFAQGKTSIEWNDAGQSDFSGSR